MLSLCIVFWCCVLVDGLRTIPLYARDFSEHCKRRDALPSVFLGRQVMESNSQVLHFSKLDLPYSCYASIRTESSHNIIMVIQLDKSEQNFCQDGYQLAVYDFVETFGGYWGPLPDALLETDPGAPVYTQQYTLEPRPSQIDSEDTDPIIKEMPATTTTTSTKSTAETQGFIDIEVPIVNLSASLVPSDTEDEKAFDIDEFFDLFYDVAPRPGRPYDTSMLPLVQIAVNKQDGRRDFDADGEPKYELEYNVGFTPDARLTKTIPDWPTKTNTNRNRNRWKKKKLQEKRVEHKKNSLKNTSEPATRKFFRKQFSLPTTYHKRPYKYITPEAITEKKYETVKDHEHFILISDIMKSLNETGTLKMQEQTTHSGLLEILNTAGHNKLSAYLAPYPTFTYLPLSDFTKNGSEILFSESTENILRISSQEARADYTVIKPMVDDKENTYPYKDSPTLSDPNVELEDVYLKNEEIVSVKEIVTSPLSILLPQEETRTETRELLFINITHEKSSTATDPVANEVTPLGTTTVTPSLSGTLVDHESWENVVQSAPVMAGLLNQHGPEIGNSSHTNTNVATTAQRKRRRKRHISAIGIDNARPHQRATARAPPPSVVRFGPADVHQFARLMELPDDQMSNHVAIKLNTNYSTQLFNLCDSYDGIKSRFLLLFNSSRIILSVGNFSMSHVMVVVTTGRPLVPSEEKCPEKLIECQVLGTRICIDYSNTCNGIPNCGSSNAYDEDRVLCRLIGPQRNVHLAAATFLTVLVTVMYIAHYWLKRCVPKVADAFFVYADSADNELYLDPIMRSPMDTATDGNFVFDSTLFDDEHTYERRKSASIFKRVFSILPKISFFKQRQISSTGHEAQVAKPALPGDLPKKMYSFTELEIRNIINATKVDREAQTGESLEMAYLKMINAFKNDSSEQKSWRTKKRQASFHSIVLRDILTGQRPSSSETSSDSPGPSGSGASVDHYKRSDLPAVGEEEELHNTLYEPGVQRNIIKSESSKNKNTASGWKCLRFNDRTIYIPQEEPGEEDGEEPTEAVETPRDATRRHSIVYRPGRLGKRFHQKPDDDDSERGGSEFRKFFRKKKDRK